jgi:uncharacterized protein
MSSERDARALRVFAVLLVTLCAAVYVPIVRAGSLGALNGFALPLLMWAPGLSAILTSATVYRSAQPLGLRIDLRTLKWIALAIAIPVAYTLLIYPPLAALGIVTLGSQNWNFNFLVIGLGVSLIFSTGEELGWRGFLAPLMVRRFGFRRANLIIGLAWAVYHVPAIFFTSYGRSAHLYYGLAMFTITVMALSYVLAWMRLSSASMWPAAFFHAEHNNTFLHLFDPMKRNAPYTDYLVGELGVLLAIVMSALAVLVLIRQEKRVARLPA